MLNWAMTYLVRWNQSTFIPPFFVNVTHEYITYQDVGLMLVCRLLLGLKQNASEVKVVFKQTSIVVQANGPLAARLSCQLMVHWWVRVGGLLFAYHKSLEVNHYDSATNQNHRIDPDRLS